MCKMLKIRPARSMEGSPVFREVNEVGEMEGEKFMVMVG